MSDSREKLFLHWSNSIQKFDYYITGVIGASVIYLIKDHHSTRLGVNPSTIELGAIVALIVALFAGITRIERIVTILRVTHDLIPKEELLKKLRSRSPGEQILSETTLSPLTEEELASKGTQLSGVVQRAREGREAIRRASGIYYSVRNVALGVGLLLLLAAKVSEPYLAQ